MENRRSEIYHLIDRIANQKLDPIMFGENKLDHSKAMAMIEFLFEKIIDESKITDGEIALRTLTSIQNIITQGIGRSFVAMQLNGISKSDHNDFRQRASDIFVRLGKLIGLDEFYDYDQVLHEIIKIETLQQLTKIQRGSQDDKSRSADKSE